MESQEKHVHGLLITSEIMGLKGLSIMQKLYLAEINALDNEQGCFATNTHFAERFGVTPKHASEVINSLKDLELIECDLSKSTGRDRVIRILDLSVEIRNPTGKIRRGSGKDQTPPPEKNGTPPPKNQEHIIQDIEQGIECASGTSDTPPVSPVSEIENTPPASKKESNTKKGAGAAEIVLPFGSEVFATTWGEYLSMRRERRFPCSANYQKTTLKKLANYEEGFALEILNYGKDNYYQGLFFSDTPHKYEKWLRAKDLADPIKYSVFMPFESPLFEIWWSSWKKHLYQLNQSYESTVTEQLILDQLKEFDEDFSIKIIKEAIMKKKWTLIWPDTPQQYQQHLRDKQVPTQKKITMAERDALFAPKPSPVQAHG